MYVIKQWLIIQVLDVLHDLENKGTNNVSYSSEADVIKHLYVSKCIWKRKCC